MPRVHTAHQPSFPQTPKVDAGAAVVFRHHDSKNPGWFFGRDPDGIEGYFPTDWFDLDEPAGIAHARRDYDGVELAVSPGDAVEVIATCGPWALVRTTAATGWIPVSCLQ